MSATSVYLFQGRILWREVPSLVNDGEKRRPLIIISDNRDIAAQPTVLCVACSHSTAMLDDLPPHCVLVPPKIGKRITKLPRPTAAVCSWIVEVEKRQSPNPTSPAARASMFCSRSCNRLDTSSNNSSSALARKPTRTRPTERLRRACGRRCLPQPARECAFQVTSRPHPAAVRAARTTATRRVRCRGLSRSRDALSVTSPTWAQTRPADSSRSGQSRCSRAPPGPPAARCTEARTRGWGLT
jgi:hypothetical protein